MADDVDYDDRAPEVEDDPREPDDEMLTRDRDRHRTERREREEVR